VRGRAAYFAFLLLHAFFILAVASRDVFHLIAEGYTALPPAASPWSKKGEALLNACLGSNLHGKQPIGQILRGYLHGAGIDAGYSYFAPNVTGGYSLIFEISWPDGRVEYSSLTPEDRESDLRQAGLLDQVVKSPSPAIRETVVRLLAQAVWQRYPGADHVKAVIGAVHLPSPSQFKAGKRHETEFLYTYDFAFSDGEGNVEARDL
jgi:hypothetical protein